MKKQLLLLPVIVLLFTSCGIFDSGEQEQVVEYQMIVQFESNQPLTSFVPRWVYTAEVVQSNRLVPDFVLLDFTEFIESGQGQLPVDLIDYEFNVTAERISRTGETTYKVTNAFTAF